VNWNLKVKAADMNQKRYSVFSHWSCKDMDKLWNSLINYGIKLFFSSTVHGWAIAYAAESTAVRKIFVVNGLPNGPVLFCSPASVVVVCRL